MDLNFTSREITMPLARSTTVLFEPGQVEQAIGTGPPPTKLTAFF